MESLRWTSISCLLLSCIALVASAGTGESMRTVRQIPADSRNLLYTSNRDPLLSSPFIKLPIGSITPKGWLRNMLSSRHRA